MIVAGNTATGSDSAEGGGIQVTARTLTLEHSAVTGNRAVGVPGSLGKAGGGSAGSGGVAEGGGVFASGANLVLSSATVADNLPSGGAGGAGGAGGTGPGGAGGSGGAAVGAGIYVQGVTRSVSITHSTVSGNVARSGSGGVGGSSIGSVGGQGGGPVFTSPAGVSGGGGGVFDLNSGPTGSSAKLTITASVIANNKAIDGAGASGGGRNQRRYGR